MSRGSWIGFTLACLGALGIMLGCGGRKTTYVKGDSAAVSAEQQLLIDAEAAWAQREDKAQLDIAIAKWIEFTEKDATNGEVFGMLARAHYLLANGHLEVKEERLAALDKGASFAERGMATNEEFRACVDGGNKDYKCLDKMTTADILPVYWAYACVGKWSALSGFTYIVKNKSKLKAIADWVQATDPDFYYGAGDRILGTYYAKAPAAFGGDLDVSLAHFNASLALEPNYLGTKVLQAQYYCPKAQDAELFKKLLEEVIAADPNSIPEIVAEQKLEQANAKRLLEQIDDMF